MVHSILCRLHIKVNVCCCKRVSKTSHFLKFLRYTFKIMSSNHNFFTLVSTQNKILITIIHLAVQTVTKHLFFLATMVMTRLTCLVLLFKIVGEICYCCLFCVIVRAQNFNKILFVILSYCYTTSYFAMSCLILKTFKIFKFLRFRCIMFNQIY